MNADDQARFRMEEKAALEGRLVEDSLDLDALDYTLASKAPVVGQGNSLQMREEHELQLAADGEFQEFLDWVVNPGDAGPPPMREWSFTEVTFADMLADEALREQGDQ